jgi:hypothetical protein
MLSPAHRAAGALFCVAVAPALLCGCSMPDNAAYCTALKAADAQWSQAGASLEDKAAATRFVATVKTVEVTAPAEVRSEWAALQTLFEKFATDRPDLSGVSAEMKEFQDAAKRIEAHAREACGIDLGQ